MTRRTLAAAGALLLLSCKTAPIPEFRTIEVPSGLTDQNVEIAIVAAILDRPPPASYDPSTRLSDKEFQALVWQHFVSDARARSWFPESRGPGVIFAAVNARRHYLRVALRYDSSSVRTEIVESDNLRQSERRIHAKALSWIGKLQERIRRELGRMSFTGRPAA